MSLLPLPPLAELAVVSLFVDIDGTLLDIAARPDAVFVEPTLRRMLRDLHTRLGGALVPISGRTLTEIDALLNLPVGAAAGLHGVELRDAKGKVVFLPSSSLDSARVRMRALLPASSGLLVEDKGAAIALHYRTAPEAEAEVRRVAAEMLDQAGPDYELLEGNRVIELKIRHADKGSALAALMRAPPLAGRAPWMVGDDVTDEDAFEQANALGGVSIIVGPRRPTSARYGLESPAAVREWISSLLIDRNESKHDG
jgi:trehalose 6-phosphate phosphatase